MEDEKILALFFFLVFLGGFMAVPFVMKWRWRHEDHA